MNVRGFVLSSGLEIVGTVHVRTNTYVLLDKALAVTTKPNNLGDMILLLNPITWVSTEPPSELRLNLCKTQYMCEYTPNKELMDAYTEHTSGLSLAH